MFNDRFGLTDAVLEGCKTVTRRIVPVNILEKYFSYEDWCLSVGTSGCGKVERQYKDLSEFIVGNGLLPYQAGEVVAVAQRYEDIVCGAMFDNWEIKELQASAGYTNKMFVKAELMPHQIEMLDVRVERLQDITDEDCIKEGIVETKYLSASGQWCRYYWYLGVTKNNCPYGQYKEYNTPHEAFANLIDEVSEKGTWESNPYVFRNEFKLK